MNTFVTLSLMYMLEGLKMLGGPAIAPPTADAVKQTYVADNMGCEACIDAVQRIINRADGVLYSSIELQTGEGHCGLQKIGTSTQRSLINIYVIMGTNCMKRVT